MACSARAVAIACTAAAAPESVVMHGTPPRERRLADRVAVRARVAALRRVDHEIAAATADEVDDRRLAVGCLAELPHRLDLDPRGRERGCRPLGRIELEAETDERGGDRHGLLVVGLADGDEHGTGTRQPPPRGPLGLVERSREVGRARHHLTGRAHLRTEDRIAAGKRANGSTAALTLHCRGGRSGGSPSSAIVARVRGGRPPSRAPRRSPC